MAILNDKKSWLVCLSGGLYFFYVFFQMNIFDVINQSIREIFHINAAQISQLSSAFVWASIICFLPAGFIVDRSSVRKSILWTMLLCILGTWGFAHTQNYVLAYLCRALIGVSNAFCFTSCMVLINRYFSPSKRAAVTGCMTTLAFIGGIIAHTPFAHLVNIIGWKNAFDVNIAIGGGILIWLFCFIKDKSFEKSMVLDGAVKNARPWELKKELKKLTRIINRQNLLAGVYTACLNGLIMIFCALWGTHYLKEVFALHDYQASNVVSMILIGSIIGGPLFGFCADKFGYRKPLMILGGLTTFILMLILLLNESLSLQELLILFFFLGLFSSTQILSYSLIIESNDSSEVGLAIAMTSIIITSGGGIGQILFGKLLQYHSDPMTQILTALDFQFALYMLPVGVLMGSIALWGVKDAYSFITSSH